MEYRLDIIPQDSLIGISSEEIEVLIDDIMLRSKDNHEEIGELTLECSTFLASAKGRNSSLSSQGKLKRLFNNITGKNQRIRDAIIQDNNNALYAAQSVMNKVMAECTNNTALCLAVNQKLNGLYMELKEAQLAVNEENLQIRSIIAAFYEQHVEDLAHIEAQAAKALDHAKSFCPKCNNNLQLWQRVCPSCGYIHPLKKENISEKTQSTLERISAIVKDETLAQDAAWDPSVQKIERALRKVKELSEAVRLPMYTEELSKDVDNILDMCKNAEFQIAIVGVMKAGKSFLMNALIGTEIASVEVNPETASLTKFRSADGYYVKLTFHTVDQWKKLKESAASSAKKGKSSLADLMEDPEIKRAERKWIGHSAIVHRCYDIPSLQSFVKKYTSSQSKDHIFVSEVEVGIDKSIFNMPHEVVFVDTPGLKDPVSYRSNITREYMKNADAILIALKPGPLTVEGEEIVSTVLDCTKPGKVYIVGTRSDEQNVVDQEKYVSNWVDLFVKSKRYNTARAVKNRIILTSAKIELLLRRWLSLSENEKEDETYFVSDDYNDLQSYCGKILKRRGFNLMHIAEEEANFVLQTTGIAVLRQKLESTLISKFRQLKRDEIKKALIPCRRQLLNIGQNTVTQQELTITLALQGVEAIEEQRHTIQDNLLTTKREIKTLKEDAKKLESELKKIIADYRKEES